VDSGKAETGNGKELNAEDAEESAKVAEECLVFEFGVVSLEL
jgi:hypothetical protein